MDSSAWLVLVIGSAALLAIAMMLARRVPGEVPAFARMPPDLAILWLVIALAPATQIVRLSTFVYDSKRTGWSPCCFIPANPPIWIVAPHS